jgi:hypothetical protein
MFRHKANQNILTEIKTQSVLVQTNSRNNGQSDIVKCLPVKGLAVCSTETGTGL